jgi:hypothetical protein
MKFDIASFQWEPEYLFNVSYKVNLYLRRVITEFLSDIDYEYDLVFSISCYANNPNDLILLKEVRGRKKPKELTQILSFPHNELEFHSDYVFHLDKFDFEYQKDAYKIYPLEKYVENILKSISLFFEKEEINHKLDFVKVKSKVYEEFKDNPGEYIYKNEELMHLEDVIMGRENDPEWLESEVGKKWLGLAKKYSIDDRGQLILQE